MFSVKVKILTGLDINVLRAQARPAAAQYPQPPGPRFRRVRNVFLFSSVAAVAAENCFSQLPGQSADKAKALKKVLSCQKHNYGPQMQHRAVRPDASPL
ncbi:MAG: hypothetical protein LBO77_08495, partial [Desulfovibrio sp.]|nr:hypothetical protein [Desulfovibrio sp.]